MFGLVRLAAIRELRGGWRLLLIASAVLIFAAALSSLPIVYSATSADLALRETIEQSPRAVKHTNHSRSRRPPTSADVAAVDAVAARARATHLAPVGPIVGETRRMSETPQAGMRWLRVDTGYEEALPGYLLTAEELRSNARLVDGRWSVQTADEVDANAPIPVMAGAALAETVGFEVGTVLRWGGRARTRDRRPARAARRRPARLPRHRHLVRPAARHLPGRG